jgi:hypothetical protein
MNNYLYITEKVQQFMICGLNWLEIVNGHIFVFLIGKSTKPRDFKIEKSEGESREVRSGPTSCEIYFGDGIIPITTHIMKVCKNSRSLVFWCFEEIQN